MINTTQPNYQVNTDYTGQRVIQVPTRMYNRNYLLGALHMSSAKFLGVDLDRHLLTFHATRDSHDPAHEFPLNKVKGVETDFSSESSGKYYLKIHLDEGDLKFKFRNPKDFHAIVEALRNCLVNGQPIYKAEGHYTSKIGGLLERVTGVQRSGSVSSDEETAEKKTEAKMKKDQLAAEAKIKAHEAKAEYAAYHDVKERELAANKDKLKDLRSYNKDIKEDALEFERNKLEARHKQLEGDVYDAALERDLAKNEYEANKFRINDEFRKSIEKELEINMDVDKVGSQERYKLEAKVAKDTRDHRLAENEERYKAKCDQIYHEEQIKKHRIAMQKDVATDEYEHNRYIVKKGYDAAQMALNQDYKVYKGVNNQERDEKKAQMLEKLAEEAKNKKEDLVSRITQANYTSESR
jgi:hypothetical protein